MGRLINSLPVINFKPTLTNICKQLLINPVIRHSNTFFFGEQTFKYLSKQISYKTIESCYPKAPEAQIKAIDSTLWPSQPLQLTHHR